jgi:hypothetical protein
VRNLARNTARLERRFRACDVGSKSCQFSEAYVIAHEIGHHVQNLLGLLPKVQEAQRGMEKAEANSLQVRVELQADCLRTVTQTPATSGAGVALPIFEPILQAIWALEIAPKAPLNGPSPEAKRYLVDLPIDYTDGSRRSRGSREGFVEHFRIGADGKIKETQYQLASREAPSRPRKAESGQDQLKIFAVRGSPERSVLRTQVRMSSDRPILNAFCRVAPSVRFSLLAIRDAPFFWRAIVLKVRTCSAVHALRFVAFLAIEQLPVSKKIVL